MTNWRDEAACIGTDTEAFFPDKYSTSTPLIKRICSSCPVQAECLDWGMRHEAEGWWGGMHSEQRRVLRQQLGIVLEAPEVVVLGHIFAQAS